MTTQTFGERARRFLQQSRGSEAPDSGYEKNERNEESPAPGLPDVPGPFPPLDAAIAASEAGRRSLGEIEGRLARCAARAAAPDATDQDRAVADDWRRVRDAKLATLSATPPAT